MQKRKMLTAIALISLSNVSMAGVEFTILGEDVFDRETAWNTAHVANDGTVLIKEQVDYNIEYYKWNKDSGYTLIPTSPWAKSGSKFSNDGAYSLFVGFSYIYNTPEGTFQVGSTAHMSGNGRVLAGSSNGSIKILVDGVESKGMKIPLPSDGGYSSPYLIGQKSINETGDRMLVSEAPQFSVGGLKTIYFIEAVEGSIEGALTEIPYQFLGAPSLSDDGHSVLGMMEGLSPGCLSERSDVIYNDVTGLITEIGCHYEFGAKIFSGDGSTVVGVVGGYSADKTSYIWDAVKGKRNLQDVLLQHGIDVQGWTNFFATDISEDGLKISGWGTNEVGDDRGFLINVVPECVAGL
mgnify:CR=1 FL=1